MHTLDVIFFTDSCRKPCDYVNLIYNAGRRRPVAGDRFESVGNYIKREIAFSTLFMYTIVFLMHRIMEREPRTLRCRTLNGRMFYVILVVNVDFPKKKKYS